MLKPLVFVVDDEEQICELLTRILIREGYAVRSFSAPQAAVLALEHERPELLVTDLMMPGMNGIELVARLRELRPEAAAVVITGYASLDNVMEAMRSGVDDFVTKPFSVADIRNVVARVLEARRAAAQDAPVRPGAPGPARPAGAETAPPAANLARRVRDMSLVEGIHEILESEPATAELAPRCAPALADALGVSSAALLFPVPGTGRFAVASAAGGPAAAPRAGEVPTDELGALTLVSTAGFPGHATREDLGPLAPLLGDGPAAAAPLFARGPHGEDAGVLVVARPRSSPPFAAEDLRILGVAAGALGKVARAVRTAERAETGYVASLLDLAAATESRTPWFRHHGRRVRDLSVALARRLDLPEVDLEVLDLAARLLDIGRAEIPDDVLGKPGRPTAEEWRRLRDHAAAADAMIRPVGRLARVKPVVRHHHENWDGSGYPDGLRSDEIPLLAALVRITDSFAALTSPRAWRSALSVREAARKIADHSGTHFHPHLVGAFLEMHAASAPGGEG